MRKKLIKLIEEGIPRVFDSDGEIIPKKQIANKILDVIPFVERLDLEPFQTWIPFACSSCFYNQAHKLGCTYDMFNETTHKDKRPPENCPLGY